MSLVDKREQAASDVAAAVARELAHDLGDSIITDSAALAIAHALREAAWRGYGIAVADAEQLARDHLDRLRRQAAEE